MPAVAGFFLGAFGVTAVPGVMAAGWAAGLSFGATAIGSLTIKLLGTVALSALSMANIPKPESAGLRTSQVLTGGTQPESFILGRYATSGVMACPPMSHGRSGDFPNAYLNYVIEIGAGDHALAQLMIDGEVFPVETTSPHASYGQRIGGRLDSWAWIKWYNGSQTTADAMLLAQYPAPLVRPWSSDMVGRGISYAVLTFRYDDRVWKSWPGVRFAVDGPPLYDVRKDSTAGGSGTQRWANPATWARTLNPQVMKYNLLRGITLTGMIYGGAVPAADLPYANWAAAMNACEVSVDDGAGGTEPMYRAGFEVVASDEPAAVIEELDKVSCGAVSESGGVWTSRVGAPGLPTFFFTDDDIIADAPEDFLPFPSIEEVFNAIEATHPDPAALWETRDTGPLTNATWEAEDGGRRLTASLSLPACPYAVQANRLIASYITDHRRMRRHVLTLPPEAMGLKVLDTVSWTSAANFYTAKLFEVTEIELDIFTGNVRVFLREVNPADYDPPTGLVRPTAPDVASTRPAAQAVPGWNAAPHEITDGASTPRRPAILISWSAAEVADARGLRHAIRLAGDSGEGTEGPLHDVSTGFAILSEGILPNTAYQVRAQLVVDRATVWSGWAAVTTPDVGLTSSDLSASLATSLASLDSWISAGINLPSDLGGQAITIRDYGRLLRILIGEAANSTAQTMLVEQQLRDYLALAEFRLGTRIDVTDEQVTIIAAAVTTLQAAIPGLATADALSALSAQVSTQGEQVTIIAAAVTTLQAAIPGLATADALSALVAEVTTQGGTITSIADSLTSLSTTVGRFSASGLLRVTVEATPAGALSRIGLKAAASSGEAASSRSAALYLEAISGAMSQVIIQADRFAVANGTGRIFPFSIAGGKVYFDGDAQSTGFVSGSTGWQITNAGAAEFNNLIVRSSLVPGAVSDGNESFTAGPITAPVSGVYEYLISPGPLERATTASDFWLLGWTGEIQGVSRVAVQRRLYRSGAWGGWANLYDIAPNEITWTPRNLYGVYCDFADNIEFRVRVEAASGTVGRQFLRNTTVNFKAVKR